MGYLSLRLTRISLLVILLLVSFTHNVIAGDNDYVDVQLRIDIDIAGNYTLHISPLSAPLGGSLSNFTTAWLGIFLDNQPGTYGALFSQVGLITYQDGIHWFVYAEPGVTCLRGRSEWGTMGCLGEAGDLVATDIYTTVNLVTYAQGCWIVKVVDTDGIWHNVAFINSNHTKIYAHAKATFEEAYSLNETFLGGHYNLSHPLYLSNEWQESMGNSKNILLSENNEHINSFCPSNYGATLALNNDPRRWYAGTGGLVCSAIMFPHYKLDLPIVFKN